MGNPVKLSHLKFGDLLFFDTTKNTYPGHVGIYIGNNLFAHASFTKGVTISSIESAYYKKRFIIGKRIVQFK
jgi:cell wall-associated NlpC family hydrolase